MNLRHEYKYLINYFDFMSLKSKLRNVMSVDENANQNDEYIVRSLYFDNLYDKALNEKLNGFDNREKFRIRIYNNDVKTIKLEKKSKSNGFTKKESLIISEDICRKIIDNDVDWMIDSNYELLRELYIKMKIQGLRPKMIVEYIRVPFIEKAENTRITFDREIKSSINGVDILNFDVPLIPSNDKYIIMEVKFDEFLPDYIKRLIKLKNTSQVAYSKYGNNRLW